MNTEISDQTTDSVIKASNEARQDLESNQDHNQSTNRYAAEGFHDILIEIVNANDNTIDWFDRLRDFDFRNGDFNSLKRRYNRLSKTTGYRQLKWSCTLISDIYESQIGHQLGKIISDHQRQNEIRRIFQNLRGSDERMITFVKDEILVKLDRFVEQVQPHVDKGNLYVAKNIQAQFKKDTQDLYKELTRKSEELSEIIDDFSRLAQGR